MPQLRSVGVDLGTQNVRAAWSDGRGRTEMMRWTERPPALPPDRAASDLDSGRLGFVLRQTRHQLGPVRFALVVPTSATSNQRERWFECASVAGLAPLRLIDAMHAACCASESTELKHSLAQVNRWLVVNAGAGRVEAATVERNPAGVQVVAAAFTNALCGNLLDQALISWLQHGALGNERQSAIAAHGLAPRFTPMEARELRESLTARERVLVPWQQAGLLRQVTVHREAYLSMVAPFAAELKALLAALESLTSPHRAWEQTVLLGGLGRTPWIQETLAHITGCPVMRWPSADELLARGAALALAAQQAIETRQSFGPTRVVPCCGRRVLLSASDEPEPSHTPSLVFAPSTPLPADQQACFATAGADQRSLALYLFEQPLPSRLPHRTARVVVEPLPPGLPARWPIEVTLHADEEGRLRCSAAVRGIQAQPRARVEWEPLPAEIASAST